MTTNTRLMILREFRKMLMEQGYEKTTIRGLGDACGIPHGNIRFYFNKKEYLLIDLLNETFSTASDIIAKSVNWPKDSDSFFKLIIINMLVVYLISRDESSYRLMAEISDIMPALTSRVRVFRTSVQNVMRIMKFPVSDINIRNFSIAAMHTFHALLSDSYHSDLPLNYHNIFVVLGHTFGILELPETEEYIEKARIFFRQMDKKQFEQKYYIALNPTIIRDNENAAEI